MRTPISSGLCALALIMAIGCASSPNYNSAARYVDSKALAANIKSALWQDPMVNSFDIDVDVLRSSVQLTGAVDTLEQKRRAERIAWNVPGVRLVENRLVVNPPVGIGSSFRREVGSARDNASMLLPRILGNPESYYGRVVEIEGTVDSVLSKNSFTINSPPIRERPLLVVTDNEHVRDLSPGDTVRVLGEFQSFNRMAAAQRLNADLEERKFAEWASRPSILAKDVKRLKGP